MQSTRYGINYPVAYEWMKGTMLEQYNIEYSQNIFNTLTPKKVKTYCLITELEMDAIFKPEKNWIKEYSGFHKEVVYSKNLRSRPYIQIRVYSSLNKNSGLSAGVGKDAIRVCAININTDKGVIKTKRINRVPGWEGRLQTRVTDVWNFLINK